MNDTDQHLWKIGELNEIDSHAWLGVDEAAQLLGLGQRQVARRAQEGVIEKRTLPKAKGEKAARVVYSRADIEALKAGNPVRRGEMQTTASKMDGTSLTAEALGLTLPDLAEALKAEKLRVIEATASLAVTVAETDLLIKSLAPAIAHARENPPLPPVEEFVKAVFAAFAATLGTALHDQADVLAKAAENAAGTIAAALQAPPAPKPWLTLDEAAEYSGLPKVFLLQLARQNGVFHLSGGAEHRVAPAGFAINVGTDKQTRWRFAREALAK